MVISTYLPSSFSTTALARVDSQSPNPVSVKTQTELGAQISATRNCAATPTAARAIVPQRLPVRDDRGDLLGVSPEKCQADIQKRQTAAWLSHHLAQLDSVSHLLKVLHTEAPQASKAALAQRDEIGRSTWVCTAHELDQKTPQSAAPQDLVLKLKLDILRSVNLPAREKYDLLRDTRSSAQQLSYGVKARFDPLKYQDALSYDVMASHTGVMSHDLRDLMLYSIKHDLTPHAGLAYARLLALIVTEDASLEPAVRDIVKDLMKGGELLRVSRVGWQMAEIFKQHGLLSENKLAKLEEYKARHPQQNFAEFDPSCPRLKHGPLVAMCDEVKQRLIDGAEKYASAQHDLAQLKDQQWKAVALNQAMDLADREKADELRQELLGEFFDKIGEMTEEAIEARQAEGVGGDDEPVDDGGGSVGWGGEESQGAGGAESSAPSGQTRRQERANQLRDGAGEFAAQYGPGPAR